MALLPLRRKACWGFFALKIRRLQPGLNPQTWVLKASTLPLDHWSHICYTHIYIYIYIYIYTYVQNTYYLIYQSALIIFMPVSMSVLQSCITHCGGSGSIPGQSMWDLWRTKCHCDEVLSDHLVFPCLYHSTNAQYAYFIHLPLTLHGISSWQCS